MADVNQKRAPITGVLGTTFGGAASLGVLLNLLRGSSNSNNNSQAAFGADADVTPFITKYESNLLQANSQQAATIAKLEAEADTSDKIVAALAPVYGQLNKQNEEICELKMGLAMESERRSCGDDMLKTYVDSNFIKAEKSINSKKINYHGVKPTLQLDDVVIPAGFADITVRENDIDVLKGYVEKYA